jgi:ArsR family transcriptional regulator
VSDPLQSDRCSKFLRAIADPERLRIVQCLRGGPKTVGQIAQETNAPFANVSHHLKLLREAGIVEGSKRGRFVSYALDTRFARPGPKRSLDVLDFGCCRVELNRN